MDDINCHCAAKQDSDSDEEDSDCCTKGRELFEFCDVEGKGYLTVSDVQKLKHELPLTDAQLQEVFNTLDEDRDGRLELEEFSGGFGMFLEIVANHSSRKRLRKLSNGRALSPIRELAGDPYEEFLENVGCKAQFKDDEGLRAMWKHITEQNSTMLPDFESFLTKIASEMETATFDCTTLQTVFSARSTESEEHLRQLYESIEKRIATEKAQLLAEENAKFSRIRQQLEEEVRQKNILLTDIRKQHDSMRDKILQMKAEEAERRKQNAQLQKERDELERKLRTAENLRLDIEREYRELSEQSFQSMRRREKSANKISSGLSIEEEIIAMEIAKLQNQNKYLLDRKDSLNSYNVHRIKGKSMEGIKGSGCDAKLFSTASLDSEEISRRGGSLYDHLHNSQSFSGNQDSFEAAFENALTFHDAENFTTKPSAPVVPVKKTQHSTELNAKVTWKVTCKIIVNQTCGYREYWKVKMKFVPSFQEVIVSPEPNYKTTETRALTDVVANSIIPLRTREPMFKVIFIGDSGVGKTSFIQRFCDDTFCSTFQSTIGIDFQEKEVTLDGQQIALQLWDTAGQERFRSICKQYFRKVHAVIVMYDVTNEQSYRSVRNWMDSVNECAEEDVVILLIGNKIDLKDRRVQNMVGSQLAEQYGATFFETSVKNNTKVQDAMIALAILLQKQKNPDKETPLVLNNLSGKDSKKKRWC